MTREEEAKSAQKCAHVVGKRREGVAGLVKVLKSTTRGRMARGTQSSAAGRQQFHKFTTQNRSEAGTVRALVKAMDEHVF